MKFLGGERRFLQATTAPLVKHLYLFFTTRHCLWKSALGALPTVAQTSKSYPFLKEPEVVVQIVLSLPAPFLAACGVRFIVQWH